MNETTDAMMDPGAIVRIGPAAWRVWLAWALILLALGYCAVDAALEKQKLGPGHVSFAQEEISGKVALGTFFLKGGARDGTDDKLVQSISENAKTPAGMIRAAIVLGELKGADAAITMLANVPKEADARVVEDGRTLTTFYAGGAAARLSPDDQSRLAKHYGWFAEVAAAFGKSEDDAGRKAVEAGAIRTAVGGVATVLLAIGGVLAGLVLFVVAMVLLKIKKIRPQYQAAARDAVAVALLESFALYLVAMALLHLGTDWFRTEAWRIWVYWSVMLALLPAALVYAWLSGGNWGEVQRRLGISRGRGLFWEIGCGVAGYVAGLPVVAVGVLTTFLLASWAHVDTSHPIDDAVVGATPWRWAFLFALACVMAPLTEELMFRGALFGWMRGKWGWLVSTCVVSFIFAALHPQGWAAIPVLASIGAVLAAIREWRGTIFASMTAHALHNGITMCVLMVMVG